MSVLLDVLLLAVFIGFVSAAWRRTPLAALLSVVAVSAAALSAFFLSFPLGDWLSQTVVAPRVEQRAANDLADLVSAPHLSSGRETVAAIDVAALVLADTEPYRQIVDAYGAHALVLRRLAKTGDADSAVRILEELTAPYAQALSRSLAFCVAFLLLWLVIRLLLRCIENNLAPPRPPAGLRRGISLVCGAVTGGVFLMAVTIACEFLRPCWSGESVSLWAGMFDRAALYQLLTKVNPLV